MAQDLTGRAILRGDVYWVDFDPRRGSEQGGVRPAVVISSNQANRSLPTVTVAAITTRIRAGSPLQMVLPAGKPTPEDSAVLGFQVMTMDQSRLDDYLGALDDAQLVELAALLRRVWGL